MKRIYMTAALIGSLVSGAFAQTAKQIDLKIRMISPSGNIANLNAGDSVRFAFELENLGPDALTTSDTTKIWMDTKIMGTAVSSVQEAIRLNMPQLALAVGEKDTLGIWIKQGENFFAGDPNPVDIQANSKFCSFMAVYGYDSDGFYFNDAGFSGEIYNNATTLEELLLAFTGNNMGKTDVITGTGANVVSECTATGIEFVSNSKKTELSVYPNPATSDLSFELSLDKVSNATARVMDITGRTVLTKDLGKVQTGVRKFTVDVSGLNNGMYIIEVATEGARAISKFNKK